MKELTSRSPVSWTGNSTLKDPTKNLDRERSLQIIISVDSLP
jgi:hypothetical protein